MQVDIRDTGSIPGLGRSAGGGHSNLLQCSCLGNPRDRRVWWATVHEVAQSWTQMKQLSMHAMSMKTNGISESSNELFEYQLDYKE